MRRIALIFSAALLGATSLSAGEIDFARDVLPILSDNCFHCHGPDETARQAALRLDTQDGAFKKKRNRSMIVPGKSKESEVIMRISSADELERMPPPDSNRKLTPKQIETLRKWVDEGAVWGQHWAYVPLPRSINNPRPESGNPIDGFIQSRVSLYGLKPVGPAEKSVWLRRVTLDLTGIPPTWEEREAFANDDSPQAFEKVVNRLLASPRYGERMAADWLDVARYADTHGYQSDRFRHMWAYRDWVINAFNSNQKYDQFVIEQLAGDLLPNATKSQRLATAFNRLHMQNEEGGVVEEEFRVAYVVDRVTTFGTAFLGQTLECCRCHDHKYDPFTQKEFYQLFAFFQNIDESGQTSYFTTAMPVPTLLLSTAEQDAAIGKLKQEATAKEAAWRDAREKSKSDFEKWKAENKAKIEAKGLIGYWPFDELTAIKSPNLVNPKQSANGHDGPTLEAGRLEKAAVLNGENGFDLPGVGAFSRSDPFSIALWIKSLKHEPRAVVLHHSRAPIDAGSRGYELLLESGRVAFGLHHMWPGNSLKVVTNQKLKENEWTHVAVSYDGTSRASGLKIAINGAVVPCEIVRDKLRKDIIYEGGEPSMQIGYRFRDNGFKGGGVDDLRIYNRALTSIEIARVAGLERAPSEDELFEYFCSSQNKATQDAAKEWHEARKKLNSFVNPIPEAMVMDEMPNPKPAFVLKRGAYDAPGDPVTAQTPQALPPFPQDLPRNRLGLARWLTHKDHPLFARVAVNRLWQQMFGRGLVETSENFGTTGTPPTHPELLDWLARDFTKDFDIKRMLKQIALSATYRQSSQASPESREKDPYNHWLSHAPVRRLSAEMMRDQALMLSGLLKEKLGGPSVYPYQPEGLWNEAMGRPHYPMSKGDDLHRRSLYTIWKRTAPHPQMTIFDAADRSNCAVRRQPTSTPLQALALLNDPQMVEAALFLGQRILKDGGDTPAKHVDWAFDLVLNRKPNEREAKILLQFLEEQKAMYNKNSKAAERLLAVGEKKVDPALDKVELAAATQLALLLLNHDGAVYRR